jgi:hypothetical protein
MDRICLHRVVVVLDCKVPLIDLSQQERALQQIQLLLGPEDRHVVEGWR